MRFGRRQARFQPVVDEQAPDLLEGNRADQALDVYAAVAKSAARFVWLGNLGRERDHSLQAGSDRFGRSGLRAGRRRLHGGRGGLYLAHCTRFLARC